MAKAAEDTVLLNKIQIGLGIIGAGLVLWALIYNRRATIAAISGAEAGRIASEAATKAADLAEDSFQRLERPYIYIYGVYQIETEGGISNSVKYSVANFGRTPAQIKILAAGMSTHPDTPIDPLIVDYRDDPTHDLLVRPILPTNDIRKGLWIAPPDGISFHPPKQYPGVFTVSHQDIAPVLTGDDQFFVWIRIQYRGPNGGYATNACWRYDKLTKRLVPWGEEEQYNGMI